MGEVPSAYRCESAETPCCQEHCLDTEELASVVVITTIDERSPKKGSPNESKDELAISGRFADVKQRIPLTEGLMCKEEPAMSNNFLPSQGLMLEFAYGTSGHLRTSVYFTEAPLGMTFKAYQKPVEVKYVQQGSLAERLGVKAGWTVLSVDGENVAQSDWKYVVRKVDDLARMLPRVRALPQVSLQALQLDFEVEGLTKTVFCHKLPLGLWLVADTSCSPTSSSSVGLLVGSVSSNGHAEQLGIQKGWSLLRVGGRSVVGEEPQDVMDSITTSLSNSIVQSQKHLLGKVAHREDSSITARFQ